MIIEKTYENRKRKIISKSTKAKIMDKLQVTLKQIPEIDKKINNLDKINIIYDYNHFLENLKDKKFTSRKMIFRLYLPYPEVTYKSFGLGLSSNYRKHINCQQFVLKMFGNKIIKKLEFKKYDVNRLNYNRLKGITHKKNYLLSHSVNQQYRTQRIDSKDQIKYC